MAAGELERPHQVLFLCTRNSARSILAECLLRRHGGGRFRSHSAGSRPSGTVHPRALELLELEGHDTRGLYSKSWEVFAGSDAPALDFVFTVCDSAAGEACPVWPGQPMTAHWGVEDPAAFQGPAGAQRLLFRKVYRELERRIELFASLTIESLDRSSLQQRLDAIGKTAPDEPA